VARPIAADGADRLRQPQAIIEASGSGLDNDALVAEVLDRIRDLLHVDTATVLLLDPSGEDLVATASSGVDDQVRHGLRVPVDEFASRIAATGEPVVLDRIDATTKVSPVENGLQLTSIAGVPILAAGHIVGVLRVGTAASRTFTADDIDLLQRAADRASLATQARLSQLDRASTLALQRSLLPNRPSPVPGFDVAARYIPGAAVGVGGDWYDLFRLPDGHIGIVIGDVAGSGLRAAVVMGRIRSALRAYALETCDPADVLTRLDRKIQLFEPGAMATAIYTIIDPSHTTLAMSAAGHLPALHIDTDGAAAPLAVPVDLPLGAYPDMPRRTTTIPIRDGTTMFFYTDGLVERRDRPVTDGITQLQTLLTCTDPRTLCNAAIDGMLGDTPATDDVAVIALRRATSSD
jgi:serine phosphatase RsbU (regulator of sigma subunit)